MKIEYRCDGDKSEWRGNKIHYDKSLDAWLYEDGQSVKDNPNRQCGHCEKVNTSDGHDGCLGTLPNVRNACCGHGCDNEAYVQFDDGRKTLRGNEALDMFDLLGRII